MEEHPSNNPGRATDRSKVIDRCHRGGQFLEILTVVALAGSIGLGFWTGYSPWLILAAFIFVGALISLYFAFGLAERANTEASHLAQWAKYAITEQRIRTLEVVKAPKDALAALNALRNDKTVRERDYLLCESELLTRLIAELGSERTNELKGLICKYTRVNENDQITTSNPTDPPRPATPTTEPITMTSGV